MSKRVFRRSQLLVTKVQPPHSSCRLMPRPHLVTRLSAILEHTCTLISAAAGSGKTTLLCQWAELLRDQGTPVAWVALDERDNDPHRFWNYLCAALAGLDADLGMASQTVLDTLPPSELEARLTALMNAFATCTQDFVLVLDDYQVITAPAIHQAIILLLTHLPKAMHVVFLTRTDPPFPLMRMRGRGQLFELRTSDLRCTPEETTFFFTKVMNLPLTPTQALTLAPRLEGWFAGLYLVALAMQECADQTSIIEGLGGSHHFILDYLITEVFQQQPEPVQLFLMQTSVLERLSGPLCDALTQGSNSHEMLVRLEQTNLFLESLDEQRVWYRYHPLFAEVLRLRLQQCQGEQVRRLHRRASAWFEEQHRFPQAVQHALAAGDDEHAVQLLEHIGFTLAIQGQVHLVQQWIHELPETVITTHPMLCLLSSMILMFTNHWEQARARLDDAEACLSGDHFSAEVDTVRGGIAVLHANIAYYTGDFAFSRQLAHQALAVLNPASTIEKIARTGALVTAAHAYLIDGDVSPTSEREVEGAVAAARAAGNLFPIVASTLNLARLQILQGKLSRAATTYVEIERLVPEQVGIQAVPSGAACAIGKGVLLYEWNELDAAEHALAQGLGALTDALAVNAEVVTQGYLAFARLHMACGHQQHAQELLETFLHLARRHAFAPHLTARGAAVSAQIALNCGDVATTIRWAETSGLAADDRPTFAYERDYLTLARLHLAQGRGQGQGRGHAQHFFLSQALRTLDSLLEDARNKERISSEIEILLLRAQVFQAQGNHLYALADMDVALALAAPERYLRIFLDEGEPVAALLKQMILGKRTGAWYASHVLQMFQHDSVAQIQPSRSDMIPLEQRQVLREPLHEPLSERELEVLRLMVGGASTQAIADALVITVNTVRRHIGHILSKFDVHSRVQAVAFAHERQLL